MARSSSPADGSQASSAFDTLLILSRTLTGTKQGGLLADALDLLLAGVGCSRGAAYTVSGDALELVGERGLPARQRAALERLPLSPGSPGSPLAPVLAAVETRKLVVDRELGKRDEGPLDRAALALKLAQWGWIVACPIVSGREVYGVLVFAWPADEEPGATALTAIEIACNMLAFQLARRSHEQRRAEAHASDAHASRMAVLGIVAGGVAQELDARLVAAARHLPAAEVLQPARAAVARFLSAIAPSAPERIDLSVLAREVLTLAAPPLARLRVTVELDAPSAHVVVGRRNELAQLFLQIVLGLAGALDDAEGVRSERLPLVPRAFTARVHRKGGHEVVTLRDTEEGGAGARASFFEAGGHARARDLDLALARQIVVAHEGHIEIGPAGDAGGTQCTVVLPAIPSDPARRPARSGFPRAQRPTSDRPRPVLLWIDEDDLFLEIMVQSLPDLDVRVARSAAEARQCLAYGTSPALVFCNVRLPDRPGHELHAELARDDPRVAARFVFVADGVLTPEIARYLIASGCPTLMRPVDVEYVRSLCARDPTAPGPVATRAPTLAQARIDQDGGAGRDGARTGAADADPDGDQGEERATLLPAPAGSGEAPPGMREHELAAIARAAAEVLRREGPKRGGAVRAMLRERGLSEDEARSVIGSALAAGILVRDAAPASVLRVPDADPGKTVLVVDDDFDLRQTLRDVLQDEGYQVETAANGKEALERLHRSNPPRAMVLDLMMPVMDGWQLLDALKGDGALADIPVVVISAGKAQAPGAHDFLSKPLDYYKLVSTLERSMARPAARR